MAFRETGSLNIMHADQVLDYLRTDEKVHTALNTVSDKFQKATCSLRLVRSVSYLTLISRCD